MSFNGSGTFVINSSGQPVVSGTTISSTVFNALTADLGVGLSTCLTKDGQTTATARIPFAAGINASLTTDATSIGTGSIISSGGISCQKALWVGGLANIAGAVTLQSTLQSTTYLSTSSIIYLGGTTASEVSLRRSSTAMQARLGDNSSYCGFESSYLLTASSILYVGGTTASEVSIRRSATEFLFKVGDGSIYAPVHADLFTAESGKYFLVGQTSNDVLLKKTSNFTVTVRKGDDSADGILACGSLVAAVVSTGNLTATGSVDLGGFDYSGALSGLTNVTFVKGVLITAS